MKYILVSKNGDFLPLLYRAHKRGKEVIAFLEQGGKMYDGLIPKAHNPLEIEIGTDDLVIFDMVGAGEAADRLKAEGHNVIGGGVINDKLELDRAFGTKFFKDHGIRTPATWEFSTMDEVREFLEDNPGRYVFKPNGNLDTSLTYVSSSVEDLLMMLPYFEDQIPPGTEFELQEFVEGIEMSTEAWFTGEKFLQPINSTFEEKKFMVGNVGPATGCMGNVVWFWDDTISNYLYKTLFEPLEKDLAAASYVGPLDINGIWTPEGIYALEFTSRFGYDAIQAASRLFTVPFEEFLRDLPTLSQLPVRRNRVALAVRVSIPPFPSDGEVPEVPILGVDDADHVYLSDVYRDEELGLLRCAGTDGYILAVAADGKDTHITSGQVYSVIDSLEIPNKQYRTDIGERYTQDSQEMLRIFRKLSVDT